MIPVLNKIAMAWWAWMGPMFLQVSLLILVISLIDLVIRKWAWPQVRYALWLLVLVKLVIPPSWTMPVGLMPDLGRTVTTVIEETASLQNFIVQDQAAGPSQKSAAAPVRRDKESTGGQTGERAVRPAVFTWQSWAFLIWLAGIMLFSGFIIIRIRRLRRWHREQEEKQSLPDWFYKILVRTAEKMKLEKLPAVVFHDRAVTPAVYGTFKPVLLLPADYFEGLSKEEAEHVLLHELAHLKRGDLWFATFSLLLHIAYWFNPLMVWVHRQMKHVREMCCDMTIADILREKTKFYRATLLKTARELLTESLAPGMGLLGVFEEPFRLVARLRWLEKRTWHNRGTRFISAGLVFCLGFLCILPMANGEKMASLPAQGIAGAAIIETDLPASGETAVHIRHVLRERTFAWWRMTRSTIEDVHDTWIHGHMMAEHEGSKDRSFIVNSEKQQVIYVDHRDSSYVVMDFPLDVDKFIDASFLYKYMSIEAFGVVDETDRSKLILGRNCREYDVTIWNEEETIQTNKVRFKVWATTEVDFDLAPYHLFLKTLRICYNRNETYCSELEEIQGLQMRTEWGSGNFFKRKQYSISVVRISEKPLPADVFTVPEGYEEKFQFEESDYR